MFIHLFTKDDFAARRSRSLKTGKKIAGDHLYACTKCTSWFRYKRYVIRLDMAYYLLGLSDGGFSTETYFCKEFDREISKDRHNLDLLADKIIKKYGKDFDFGAELMKIQEEYKNKGNFLQAGINKKVPFEKVKQLNAKFENAKKQHEELEDNDLPF